MTRATDAAKQGMAMEPRIVKTEEQYRRYLDEVARLAAKDPDAGTDDGARLELLAKLVEDYEKTRFHFAQPDPVEAILFRMEQQGLRQKDIADLLGGKNRASEVLARKRPLTLSMIRALHERLAIPSDSLIREPAATYAVSENISVADVPVALLTKRGWIDSDVSVHDLLNRFLAPAGSPVLMQHTAIFGANARTNRTHVWFWVSRVREVAQSRTAICRRFRQENLNGDALQYLAKLSWMAQGPRLAKEFLEERGIALVIEPHLPSTHLDGAALLGRSGTPVIGLTLREDRLDNFWFTLMHELVHAWKHLNNGDRHAIVDENIEKSDQTDALEREAHEHTAEIFIPRCVWRRSEAFRKPSAKAINALAAELQISPAVVAGRVRRERRNFSLFSGLVGIRQVRPLFPDVKWS
jgi:HTH-type transcriptional regulator / antitoxin HigA